MLNNLEDSQDSNTLSQQLRADVAAFVMIPRENWAGQEEGHEEEEVEEEEGQGTGVLIIPSDDEGSETERMATNDRLYETAMNLSVPGTDSLPSDIGSLHVDLFGRRSRRPSNEQQQAPQNLHHHPNNNQQFVHMMPHIYTYLLSVLVFLLALSLGSNLYLFRQQTDLNRSTTELRQELFLLRQKLTTRKPPPPPPLFDWETDHDACGGGGASSSSSSASSTLVDNCWLQAKANVKLGECANDAKDRVQESVRRLGDSLWKAQEVVREKVQVFASKASAAMEEATTNLFEEAPADSTTTTDTQHNCSSEEFPLNKAVREAATVLVSGVAFASLASLLTSSNDDALGSFLEQARNVVTKGARNLLNGGGDGEGGDYTSL